VRRDIGFAAGRASHRAGAWAGSAAGLGLWALWRWASVNASAYIRDARQRFAARARLLQFVLRVRAVELVVVGGVTRLENNVPSQQVTKIATSRKRVWQVFGTTL